MDDNTITAKAKYSINISKSRKKTCLHWNIAPVPLGEGWGEGYGGTRWMHKPYLSGSLNYCCKFYYSKLNRAFKRKTNDISLLLKQRNTHISILIVSARTFSCPTEAITESCSLKQVFLKSMWNPWKITENDFPFKWLQRDSNPQPLSS